jgi:two-component system phosphate regulon sensor histidine kinase PhoR
MKRKSLFWHIFPAFFALEIITLAAVAWFATRSFRDFHYGRTRDALESIGHLAAQQIKAGAPALEPSVVSAMCRTMSKPSHARLTVVTPPGIVIADSDYDPSSMDNHADRPEIRQAWKSGFGTRIRLSGTLQEEMMYVAVPLRSGGENVAVVRAARALDDINQAARTLTERVILFGVLVALLGAGVATVVARRITHPLDQIREGAEAFAAGNLDQKLPSSTVSEIDVLTSAMNRMSEELNDRIATITRQRDEENALFSCMTEAVIAVDTERCVIKMNDSARAVLDARFDQDGPTPIAEVIRNADLLKIVDATLGSDEPTEGDIFIPERELYLQAHGTALHDSDGHHVGAVIAINDVTRLRRLATMRRDFVANVSHELKTPITSIKGFAETLVDEASPEDPQLLRFLEIINHQADRLQSIVEDLLALADIEHCTERDAIEFSVGSVARLVENAAGACQTAARERDITLAVESEDGMSLSMNPQLLEQAVTNLIDNAIRYSFEHTTVNVSAKRDGAEVAISVQDEGPGIARKHLPRLFERFYRVDKSRSRKLGGTGLGLAICKRITLAHGGRVAVESVLGKGSTFTIRLPLV